MKIATTAASVLCLWALAAQAADRAAPIRVGLIAPLTGGSADFGNSLRGGAELAVNEINRVGGYLGRPLQLVVRDDQAVPERGLAAAEDLVQREKVDFTLGFCNTGVALKALPVFERAHHLLMVPCAQGSAVTRQTPAARSMVFRLAPADHMNARFLVREIVERRGLKRVAILADRTGYGDGGLADLGRELELRGLRPQFVARFGLGVSSLRDELEAARASGAEAIVNYTVGPEQAVAVQSRAAMGWKVPYFAPWPLSFRSVLQSAGAAALEGTLMTQSIILDGANERRVAFISSYRKQSIDWPVGSLMSAAQSYDAVHLLLRALFQTRGNTSGPALKAALEDLRESYRGVVTTYERPYSADDHEAFSDRMIWLGEWRGGTIVYHYPADARLSSAFRRKHN